MNEQTKQLESKSASTFWAEICMAGDVEVAKQVCRQFTFRESRCVTVSPTTFIYTGGEESGFLVRFTSYPRFPEDNTPEMLQKMAKCLATELLEACCQWTGLIITPVETIWLNRRKDK